MTPGALFPAKELTPIEARIEAEATRFDLRPLLSLLSQIGYGREAILFESTESGRSPSLVQAVRFVKSPPVTAIISVHVGLLGDNTLLPSYFFYLIERSPDPAKFFDFLRFFDHRLIENMFAVLHPEIGEDERSPMEGSSTGKSWLFGNYRGVLRSFFRMSAPNSPGTLHSLVQLYFPEFRVRVSRQPFAEETDRHACLTGVSKLDGSAILGATYVTEMPGFLVDLIVDDEVDLSGREQADIVKSRLEERLLPLLTSFHLPLTIRLVVLWHSSAAYVDDPSAEDKSFLGYNRLHGARNRPEIKHTTVMYRGLTDEFGQRETHDLKSLVPRAAAGAR
ncbi:MAG TPA: hypothetical protein VFQ35_15455 [Polyangiaceae bacterium]|nr:hypothetical protein [Polyangiaceae bacterium]